MKPHHKDSEITIRDYNFIRADRPTVIKGGVILYTHQDIVVDDKAVYADGCVVGKSHIQDNMLIIC